MNESNRPRGEGFWVLHSQAWKESGLSQEAYCEKEGLSYRSFVYQHHRLTCKATDSKVGFIEAKPLSHTPSSKPESTVVFILPNGIKLCLNGEVERPWLETVMAVAGGVSC